MKKCCSENIKGYLTIAAWKWSCRMALGPCYSIISSMCCRLIPRLACTHFTKTLLQSWVFLSFQGLYHFHFLVKCIMQPPKECNWRFFQCLVGYKHQNISSLFVHKHLSCVPWTTPQVERKGWLECNACGLNAGEQICLSCYKQVIKLDTHNVEA